MYRGTCGREDGGASGWEGESMIAFDACVSERKFGSAGRQVIGGARVGGAVKEMQSLRPGGAC